MISAATYGFNQSDWSSGSNTGATAIHDNNQENYNEYYSKDDNIKDSVYGEISLINASTTLTEANSSDFNSGIVDSPNFLKVATDGDNLSLAPVGQLCGGGYYYYGSPDWDVCKEISVILGGTSPGCPQTSPHCSYNYVEAWPEWTQCDLSFNDRYSRYTGAWGCQTCTSASCRCLINR